MAKQIIEKPAPTELTADEKAALEKVKARRAIDTVYAVKNGGIDFLVGKDADELIGKIEQPDMDPSCYRFYDDERRKWAYIVVINSHGNIEPLTFPAPDKYGTTSSELYSKAVTYPTVLAQCIELITKAAPSLWERIMKPTTIITAIVVVLFIVFILAVAMTG